MRKTWKKAWSRWKNKYSLSVGVNRNKRWERNHHKARGWINSQVCSSFMRLLQGESDFGLTDRSMAAACCRLHRASLFCTKPSSSAETTPDVQVLLHSVQPAICWAYRAAWVSKGPARLLQRYPNKVQTSKSLMMRPLDLATPHLI